MDGARLPSAQRTSDDASFQDASWLSRLHRNRSGRTLQDHLACVEDRLDSQGREGSIQEAINNRRTFMRALNNAVGKQRPLPCGLPSPIPKYVAIVNLSGQRMMLTSNRDTLMRKLCSRSWLMHPDTLLEQLCAFEAFLTHTCLKTVTKDGTHIPTEQFVLITYSLPWQSGVSNAFWEVNAVNIIGDRSAGRFVCDRTCSLTSMSSAVFGGESSLGSRGCGDDGVVIRAGKPEERVLDFIGNDQVKAFTNAYAAVHLDFEHDDASGATAEADASATGGPAVTAFNSPGVQTAQAKAVNAQLHSLVTVLKEGRLEDQSKIRKLETQALELKSAHAKKLQAEQEEMLAKVEEATSRARNREQAADAAIAESKAELDGMRPKMASMMLEQAETRSMYDKLLEKHEKVKRQEAGKDKLHNTHTSKQSIEIKRLQEKLEAEAGARQQDLAEMERAHAQALQRGADQTHKEREALKQKLASTELMCNQLVANAENSGRELAMAQATVEELRAEATLWREKEKRARAASDVMAKWNAVLVVAERTLLAELALLDTTTSARGKQPRTRVVKFKPEAVADERAHSVPVRSVGVDTDTQSTATHCVGETQTPEARVLAEHLPEGALREKLKPPPPQQQQQPRPKAPVTDDEAQFRASPPSPTPSTGSTQEPPTQQDAEPPLLLPRQPPPQLPLNPAATPFGSPAMACLQAEAAFNHVLEWMRYFGAVQLHQQGVMSPHAAGPPRSSPPPMMMMHQQPPHGNHRGRPQHYPHHRGGAGSGY